ncbi:PREDICTED: gonadal protein gdl [Rhagoletis zephyria]|uniref:gonadal protein gdl n=1 Tax=Rhagoletis zephyria TaxID=28612 RepID=UPI00081169F3|nr:PREDICTED: gonadal protein gdl [Rhagoletis zephyria]
METELPSTSASALAACSSNASTSAQVQDYTQLTPELLQRKLYFLVDQLKQMHAQLPEKYQIRISYELLTELANSLLNDTIFEIVKGLMEIQNVTERHLLTLRKQIETDFELEMQEWRSKITDPEELSHIEQLMQVKHAKKLRETDMKLIALLDQKVKDQQSTLLKAGVAGFYVTDNPREIKIQMFLLDFIIRLSRIKFEPYK